MDENKAKTQWCPMARLSWHRENHEEINMNGYNRVVDDSADGPANIPAAKCIASECMAWRLHYNPEDGGYCGLVGSPFKDIDKEKPW